MHLYSCLSSYYVLTNESLFQGDGGNIGLAAPTPQHGTNENVHLRGNNKVKKKKKNLPCITLVEID